ncbi:type II toxin-antitoxin system HicA family toxin [Methylotuvimicrobium sp. KM2]|uniref:type II toxin-antitoxin system HicA family toxin n=1 Tax=Methylotuvimicrobium sp. KM2 TaxID=3133976 RepID=UPI003100F28F
MSSQYPPLTCKEVKRILAYLGFVARPQKGTSHEQWVKEHDGALYKVTVDCPKSPFTQTLIKSMAAQAGITKKEFYRIFRLIK